MAEEAFAHQREHLATVEFQDSDIFLYGLGRGLNSFAGFGTEGSEAKVFPSLKGSLMDALLMLGFQEGSSFQSSRIVAA